MVIRRASHCVWVKFVHDLSALAFHAIPASLKVATFGPSCPHQRHLTYFCSPGPSERRPMSLLPPQPGHGDRVALFALEFQHRNASTSSDSTSIDAGHSWHSIHHTTTGPSPISIRCGPRIATDPQNGHGDRADCSSSTPPFCVTDSSSWCSSLFMVLQGLVLSPASRARPAAVISSMIWRRSPGR